MLGSFLYISMEGHHNTAFETYYRPGSRLVKPGKGFGFGFEFGIGVRVRIRVRVRVRVRRVGLV